MASPPATRFEAALARSPAPRRLGDVRLGFDAFLLVGETPRGRRSWAASLAWVGGVAGVLAAALALGSGAGTGPAAGVALATLAAFGAAAWLEQRDRRRRAFVANFAASTLRLDFVTPFAGRPRTLVVPFDAVRAVGLWAQADGAWCLTVDFVPAPTSPDLLREVLAANIPGAQREDAERLRRVLEGAFGLTYASVG